MRVKREAASELVVVESTVWLSCLFFCVAVVLFYAVGLHGRDHTWKAFLPAGFLLAFAAAFDLSTQVTFDNIRRQAECRRRRLLWVKSWSVAFDDIQGVVIESTTAKNNQLAYRLTILTAHGPVPMSDTYSGGQESHAQLREKILRFLNLPAEGTGGALDEASIRLLVAEGRKVDAIQQLCSSKHIGLGKAKQLVEEIAAQIETK